MNNLKSLGFGIGLRNKHYQDIIASNPNIDWFEVITENYMVDGGATLDNLEEIRKRYPIVMHGVSLSIGSTDKLNYDYLSRLRSMINRFKPAWISDHLCWTGVNGINSHDLLPLPYTKESLCHIVNRLKEVQDYLGQQILLENPSSYIEFEENEFSEWDYFAQVLEKADCLALLDINNIYVSANNLSFDPIEYLESIPKERVQQFHLAGHIEKDKMLIDTHGAPIKMDVWDLYKIALKKYGFISTLIERDNNIPELGEMLKELEVARRISWDVIKNY